MWAAIRPCIYLLAGSFDSAVWRLGLPVSWPGEPWASWPWPWARGPGPYIQLFQYPLWVLWKQSSASKLPWILVGLIAALNAYSRVRRNSILVK